MTLSAAVIEPAPLTPADCDLRDFPRMMLDVDRLRKSKTWLIAKRRPEIGFYALNLWMAAWHQCPVASLENDDDVLADAAECPPGKWAKVREDAMRGWKLCSDGRFYHATLAEIALESWIEKLIARLSSGVGNEGRWGRKFDRATVESDIDVAARLLENLNPQSKALIKLKKKNRKKAPDDDRGGGQKESERDPPRNPGGYPGGMQTGSQENRTEQNRTLESPPAPPERYVPPARESGAAGAVPIAVWINDRLAQVFALVPELNRTTAGLCNIAPLRKLCEPPEGQGPPCDWEADVLPAIAAVAARCAASGRPLRSFTHPAIADQAQQNRDRRLNPEPAHEQPRARRTGPDAARNGSGSGSLFRGAMRLKNRLADAGLDGVERESEPNEGDDFERRLGALPPPGRA
ncbi:MAG: DUF1376 domain-containing protein [Hyphomonadaceae bacterium]